MNSHQSHYRINVAKITGTHKTRNGHGHTAKYFFDVIAIGEENAREIFDDLVKKYPHPEYSIDMTYWDIKGILIVATE